jgi:hypothetical protein
MIHHSSRLAHEGKEHRITLREQPKAEAFGGDSLHMSYSILTEYRGGSHHYIAEVNGQCEMRDEQ